MTQSGPDHIANRTDEKKQGALHNKDAPHVESQESTDAANKVGEEE